MDMKHEYTLKVFQSQSQFTIENWSKQSQYATAFRTNTIAK